MIARLHGHKHQFFAIIALAFIMAAAFGIREAISADADLQQYNGSPSFDSDWTTQAKLLVRDGKKITADDNGAGKAPVNRGLKQIVDILGGLHDATIGSRTGAARKTFKSLEVDGTGGATSTLTAGWITSTTANDSTLIKPTSVQVFKISPTGGEAALTKGALTFTNTADGGGNPARTSPINNKVIPLNTAKAWVDIQTQMGVVNYGDGHNITSCTVQSNTEVYCDMAVSMDSSTSYMSLANTALGDSVECMNTSASRITCTFAGTQNCNGAAGCKLKLLVFGRQTT